MTTTETANDNPGVRFPPPVAYVAAVGVGYLMQRLAPLPIGGGIVRVAAAWTFVAGWAVVVIAAFYAFWSRHTTIVPVRPATTLVVAGPYRFTRNPMYVALALLTLAVGLWMNTWWVILLLVPALIVIDRIVIAREEAYLGRRFGAEYDQYTRRVRRWI